MTGEQDWRGRELRVVDLEMICTCSEEGCEEAVELHQRLDALAGEYRVGRVPAGREWLDWFCRLLLDAAHGSISDVVTDQWSLAAITFRMPPTESGGLGEQVMVRAMCDSVPDGLAAVLLYAVDLRSGTAGPGLSDSSDPEAGPAGP
jgi:hypothetical protein